MLTGDCSSYDSQEKEEISKIPSIIIIIISNISTNHRHIKVGKDL